MSRLHLRQRIFVTLILVTFVAALCGKQPARAAANTSMLVAVFTPNENARARFDQLSLPVYHHVDSQRGEFVLTGLHAGQTQVLAEAQLAFLVLDEDTSRAAYYLAYPPIKRPAPDWNAYGQMLLDGGSVVILRADPRKIAKLPDSGVELAAITLTAKPKALPATHAYPSAVTPDPIIQTMINQVMLGNVRSYTGDLSGEWPVIVTGQPYTITTRNTYSGTSIQRATQYVGEHLGTLGLDVEYHQWAGTTYPNVIGELTGLTNPDQIYIIGGHLDNMPSSGRAPGADDNASGSVATLLAADILSQYQWGCTLRFAFWTGEEQGLNGSEAYAQRAYNAGEDILGYLNLDMIAWNEGGSAPGIDLLYNANMPTTLQLAQLFADTVDAYDINLTPQLVTSLGGGSDHSSFWDQGYTAILAIEDQSDFNPYYHTINDDMNNFEDWGYYVSFVKAAIGTFAHMSGCLLPNGLGSIQGTVSDAATGAPIENAIVTFESDHGYSVDTRTDLSGYYTRTLVADTYTVTTEAYGYLADVSDHIIVAEDSTTTHNVALTTIPTYTLSGNVTDSANGFPLLANILIEGLAQSIWTNPEDGHYEIALPQGQYRLEIRAHGYHAQAREIQLTSNQVHDFALEALACILLVDDDDSTPNVQASYVSTLDALGLPYDLRNIATQGEPQASDLNGYRHVIWFTGNNYTGTLSNDNEIALGAYLDQGGNLLLSSQDYLLDNGKTSFGVNYLHLASYRMDQALTTLWGTNVFAGLGSYHLTYPFANYSDAIQPDLAARIAFTGTQQNTPTSYNAAISYDGSPFHTLFLAYPLEAVGVAGRQEIVSRALEFFGGCAPSAGQIAGQVSDALSGQAIAEAGLQAQPGGETATTDSQGRYSLVLPSGEYDLTVQHACYISQTVSDVPVSEGMTTTKNILLQPLPPIAEIPSTPVQVYIAGTQPVTRSVAIANDGCTTLDYTATVTANSPWLQLGNSGGEIPPSASAAIQLTLDASGLADGTYTTTLHIQTNDPAHAQTEVPVSMTVGDCIPINALDFTWTPALPTAGETITFTASTSGTLPVAFTWYLNSQEFGNGATATLANLPLGQHEISLSASNVCSTDIRASHTLRIWLQKVFLALVTKAAQP